MEFVGTTVLIIMMSLHTLKIRCKILVLSIFKKFQYGRNFNRKSAVNERLGIVTKDKITNDRKINLLPRTDCRTERLAYDIPKDTAD